MKRFLIFVIALAVAGGSFWLSLYLTRDTDSEAMGRPDRETPTVEVAAVERDYIRETRQYPGTVQAMASVTILPKVTGKVEEILVDLGDRVERGQLLLTIEQGEFEQRVRQARANLQLALAQLERSRINFELAQRDFARVQQSAERGIVTSQEVDSATAQRDAMAAEVDLARAEVERLKSALDEAQLNLDNTRIASPLDGVVEMRNVDPGALATQSTPLMTIVKSDPAKVVVHVPESDITMAEVGKEAKISVARGAYTMTADVTRVAPTLSQSTRTTLVEILVANEEGRLRPGMSADVEVLSREADNALVVPEGALVVADDGAFKAFMIVDGKAREVPIEAGIQQGGMVQIIDGLEEGDLVITQGQFMVRDGQPVRYGENSSRRVGS